MEFIKSIILLAGNMFEFVIGIVYRFCSFFGDKTIKLMTLIDPSCINEFNKIFKTTNQTVSIIIGTLELTLLSMFIKYIITGIRDICYSNEHKSNIHPNSRNLSCNKGYRPSAYSNSMFGGMGGIIDESESEQEPSGKFPNFGEDNDFSNQLLLQQMIDEANREFMKASMDEAMRAITPEDEGGYVHGPYLNPSDTFAYEEQQSMFNDFNNDFDSFESNDMFDSLNSFNDSGYDNSFDSTNDFGCDNNFNSFNDFGSGF